MVVRWGKAAASARWMLPVVTKGKITEVITGWAKLSPCASPVLEPGRAGGAGWEPGGVSAEPWDIKAMKHQSHRNTLSKLQVPGSRSRIPGLAQSREQLEELEADPFPASHPQLAERAAAVPRGSPESFYRAGTIPTHLRPGDRHTPSLRP